MNDQIKSADSAPQAPPTPKIKTTFVVSRYLETNEGKTYMGDYGRPFDTLEAAEKHLAFVRKTIVGVSSVNKPFLFEIRKLEEQAS